MRPSLTSIMPHVPVGNPGAVTVADLTRLDSIRDLLATLNDANAGARALSKHIAEIPVLRARIENQFARKFSGKKIPAVVDLIALVGNRQIEEILLLLLEDLTILRGELDAIEEERNDRSGAAE